MDPRRVWQATSFIWSGKEKRQCYVNIIIFSIQFINEPFYHLVIRFVIYFPQTNICFVTSNSVVLLFSEPNLCNVFFCLFVCIYIKLGFAACFTSTHRAFFSSKGNFGYNIVFDQVMLFITLFCKCCSVTSQMLVVFSPNRFKIPFFYKMFILLPFPGGFNLQNE